MSVHRYCLLGLPRTGSQYIANLLVNTVGTVDMSEPFTENTVCKLGIDIDNEVTFNSIEERIEYVFNQLNKIDSNKALVMRLFLVDSIQPYVDDIIKRLVDLNFKFLVIHRENLEHHLLSFLIAVNTNIWHTLDNNNEPYSADFSFEIVRMNNVIWLYDQRLAFNTMLNQLNINYSTIRYEYAIDDLEQFLGILVTSNDLYKKQIVGDPYKLIANASEVKQFLEKLMNK